MFSTKKPIASEISITFANAAFRCVAPLYATAAMLIMPPSLSAPHIWVFQIDELI